MELNSDGKHNVDLGESQIGKFARDMHNFSVFARSMEVYRDSEHFKKWGKVWYTSLENHFLTSNDLSVFARSIEVWRDPRIF